MLRRNAKQILITEVSMNSVIKGASYILAFTPDMVIHNGTTQTTERTVNPNSEYLKQIKDHLRTFKLHAKSSIHRKYDTGRIRSI